MTYRRDLGVNLAGVEVILQLVDHLSEVHHRVYHMAEQLCDLLDEDDSPLCPIPMTDAQNPPRPQSPLTATSRRGAVATILENARGPAANRKSRRRLVRTASWLWPRWAS